MKQFKNPLVLLALLGLFTIAAVIILTHVPVWEWAEASQVWVQNNYLLSCCCFVVFLALWSMLLPTSVPILLAGYWFGFWVGSSTTLLATTIAFICAFALGHKRGRVAMSEQLEKYPRLKNLEQTLSSDGWRFVILMRLSPIVPYHIQNYWYGMSSMHFWPCLTATLIGKTPNVLATVAIGTIWTSLQEDGSASGNTMILIISVLATVLLLALVTHRAKQALSSKS